MFIHKCVIRKTVKTVSTDYQYVSPAFKHGAKYKSYHGNRFNGLIVNILKMCTQICTNSRTPRTFHLTGYFFVESSNPHANYVLPLR